MHEIEDGEWRVVRVLSEAFDRQYVRLSGFAGPAVHVPNPQDRDSSTSRTS